MKRFVVCLLCIALCIGLSACSLSKSGVKLASEHKLLSWCENTYGDCEVLAFTTEQYKHTAMMKDAEKKFTYSVESYVSSAGLDGSTFCYYENKQSDFDEKYFELFYTIYESKINAIMEKYGSKFDFDTYVFFCEIYANSEADSRATAEEFVELMKEYDTREYWKDASLRLYGSFDDDDYIGSYEYSTGFISEYDETSEWFLEIAASAMGVSKKDLQFVRRETVPVSSLPGYDPEMLVSVLGMDNDITSEAEVCYFTYKGNTYYISDILQYDDEYRMYHLGEYPVYR
jgi:hypothetical protein